MRRHMWMHVGMLAAILAIVALRASGVTLPNGVVYLVLLACPLMMVFMMFGMSHEHDGTDHEPSRDADDQPNPPADTPRQRGRSLRQDVVQRDA